MKMLFGNYEHVEVSLLPVKELERLIEISLNPNVKYIRAHQLCVELDDANEVAGLPRVHIARHDVEEPKGKKEPVTVLPEVAPAESEENVTHLLSEDLQLLIEIANSLKRIELAIDNYLLTE